VILRVWFVLQTFLSGVAVYCALDGALGSATLITLFAIWAGVSLWPVLSGSHARRSVAAGPR
jgi:hypothetical protein